MLGAAQLSFDHVRVPREYMLMRFAKARPPHARLIGGWGLAQASVALAEPGACRCSAAGFV